MPLELLKPIAWGNLKIMNDSGLIDHPELAPGWFLDVSWQTSYPQAAVDALGR